MGGAGGVFVSDCWVVVFSPRQLEVGLFNRAVISYYLGVEAVLSSRIGSE